MSVDPAGDVSYVDCECCGEEKSRFDFSCSQSRLNSGNGSFQCTECEDEERLRKMKDYVEENGVVYRCYECHQRFIGTLAYMEALPYCVDCRGHSDKCADKVDQIAGTHHEVQMDSLRVTGYHATSRKKAESIARNGFRPSEDGMLGAGVYWSDNPRKTLNYGQSCLKLAVRCGKVKRIEGQGDEMQYDWNDYGYDTAWVPAGCGMVESELSENCTFETWRVEVVAIRLGDNGKFKRV